MADRVARFVLPLRRDTARVLYAWLDRTDLNLIPMEHRAEKQAFADLHGWLETDCDGPYISRREMARAHEEILLAPNARDDARVLPSHVEVWRQSALVIYAWLERVPLASLRESSEAERRSLEELHDCLKTYTDGPRVTNDEITLAREEVSRDMGW